MTFHDEIIAGIGTSKIVRAACTFGAEFLMSLLLAAHLLLGMGTPSKDLDSAGATLLAQKLANQKCDSVFGKRPFKIEDYVIEFRDSVWIWKAANPGKRLHSVKVTFKRDGSEPNVDFAFVGVKCLSGTEWDTHAPHNPLFIPAPEWKARADSLYRTKIVYIFLNVRKDYLYPIRADSQAIRQFVDNARSTLEKKKNRVENNHKAKLSDKDFSFKVNFFDTVITLVCDSIRQLRPSDTIAKYGDSSILEGVALTGKVLGAQGGRFNFKVGPGSLSGELEYFRQPDKGPDSWMYRSTHLYFIRYLGPPGIHLMARSIGIEG